MIDFHSKTLPTHARWEVLLDGENVWHDGDAPQTYASEEEAWQAITDYFKDCEEAEREGFMIDVDYDLNFRVEIVK